MAHDVLSRQSPCVRLFLFILLLAVPGTSPAWAQTMYGFVANGEPVNTVTIFDASTHTVVGTMTGSINQARSVAISPDGRRVYVLNAGVNTISVFDTVTRTEIAGSPIATNGVWPLDMVMTPDGKKGFIMHSGGTITVIDLTTNTLVGSPLNPGNGDSLVQMKMTPDGSTAYVTAASSGRIWVVDVATNTITGFLEPIAGNYPMNGIALSPDGQTAWITSLTNNAVRAIDLTNDTASGVISVGTSPTGGIAVSPDGLFVYVTNKGSDNVSVIDTATKTVVQTIAVGVGPDSVAFTADGTLAYVVNNWYDSVSVIDTSTRTVIDTLTGFHTPFTEGGHFIGPLVMAPGAPASIASDADLTALGFGSLVPLQGGSIQLGGAWTTTRTPRCKARAAPSTRMASRRSSTAT
jgi:YVTN family beta-propeller protein